MIAQDREKIKFWRWSLTSDGSAIVLPALGLSFATITGEGDDAGPTGLDRAVGI